MEKTPWYIDDDYIWKINQLAQALAVYKDVTMPMQTGSSHYTREYTQVHVHIKLNNNMASLVFLKRLLLNHNKQCF